jgi:hypothetical protein
VLSRRGCSFGGVTEGTITAQECVASWADSILWQSRN